MRLVVLCILLAGTVAIAPASFDRASASLSATRAVGKPPAKNAAPVRNFVDFFRASFCAPPRALLLHRPSPMTPLLLSPAPPSSSSISFFVVPPTTSVRPRAGREVRSRPLHRLDLAPPPAYDDVGRAVVFFESLFVRVSNDDATSTGDPPPHGRRHSSSPLPPSLSSWEVVHPWLRHQSTVAAHVHWFWLLRSK